MIERWEHITELQRQLRDINKHHFFTDVLFSYQWWILTLVFIAIWILWFILVDKHRLKSILLMGLFTSIQALIYDDLGLSLVAWNYPYPNSYVTSRMDLANLAVLPVAYMLLYQYFRKWRYFLIALAAFCLFSSFIAEPIFEHLHMYKVFHWKHIYSAPIYFVMGVWMKGFIDWLDRRHPR